MLPPPPVPDQDRDDFAEIKFAGAEGGRYRNIYCQYVLLNFDIKGLTVDI